MIDDHSRLDTHTCTHLRYAPALPRGLLLPLLAGRCMSATLTTQDFGALGRAEVTVACIPLGYWCAGCWTVHLVLPSTLVVPDERLDWRFWVYFYTQISHHIPFHGTWKKYKG